MKNYKPSIGSAAQTGQAEPITIDIDIRYVSLFHGQDEADEKSDDAPPIPLVFNPGGMYNLSPKQWCRSSLTSR